MSEESSADSRARPAVESTRVKVAAAPSKPLLVYDGECAFCCRWVKRLQRKTGDKVDYRPFQAPDLTERFPEVPTEYCADSVRFIESDGHVYQGAEAIFRVLAREPASAWPLRWYQRSRLFARFAEVVYRFVVRNRRRLL